MKPRPGLLLAAAAVLISGGCAGAGAARPRLTAHGSITLPAEVRRVGLSHAHPSPGFSLRLPSTRSAASAGFAREMISNPGEGAFAAPAAYVLGRAIGATLGIDESKLDPAHQALRAAAREFPAAPRLEDIVARTLGGPGGRNVSLLEAGLPVEPPHRPGRFTVGGESRIIWASGSAETHPLHDTLTDTLVSLRVVSQGLRGPSLFRPDGSRANSANEFNPPLTCEIVVEVTAVRVRDWALLGGIVVRSESRPRRFLEWADHDARALRAALASGWTDIDRELSSRLAAR